MTYNYFTTQIYNNKTDNKLLQPLLKENNLKREEIYFSIL